MNKEIKLGESVLDATHPVGSRFISTPVAVEDFIWANVRTPIEEMINEFVAEVTLNISEK